MKIVTFLRILQIGLAEHSVHHCSSYICDAKITLLRIQQHCMWQAHTLRCPYQTASDVYILNPYSNMVIFVFTVL